MSILLPSSPQEAPFLKKSDGSIMKENIPPDLKRKKMAIFESIPAEDNVRCLSPILCTPQKSSKNTQPKVLGTKKLNTKVKGRTEVNKNMITMETNPENTVHRNNKQNSKKKHQ